MDNENFQNTEPLTDKEKAEAAGKDIAEVTAKGIGQAYGGKVGNDLLNIALKTKGGQKVLEGAGKKLSNSSPVTRKLLANNQETIHRSKPILNSLAGSVGDDTDNSFDSTIDGLDDYYDSYDDGDNVINHGKTSGSFSISGLWNKLSFKNKLIIIGVCFGIVSVVIFLVVLITPLMELGIIDISDVGNDMLSYSSNTYLMGVGNNCESIIVDGEVVDFEHYVAGVTFAENYKDQNIEAYKAQAIAARTYAIKYTNFCQKSIVNDSAAQNYDPDPSAIAIEAAEATKGLVLTYNSKIFLSEYSSFSKRQNYYCESDRCYTTYFKLPNKEEHVVSIPESRSWQVNGGHNRGMSQVVAYDLADQGYTYEEILYYFYSPGVQISSLNGSGGYSSGLSASGDFAVRNGMPVEGNAHDNKYWFSNENISYSSGNLGQCTWYAYGRANEILDYAGSDLNWRYAPHAKDWLTYNINAGVNAFSYSTNVNEPKEGAIIVWSSDKFGHVAIVEKVNSDGTIDYSEANISSAKSNSNPYGFRYQSHISYTGTGVGTISNIWNGYNFVGYIYMVE